MKKIFSKIIAGISAVSILSTLSVSSFTTFALRYPEYDLNNEAYIEFLDTHTTKILEGEEEFIKYSNISGCVNSFLGWTYTVGEVKHIYYSNITSEELVKEYFLNDCFFEFEYFDGTRTFVQGDIYTYGMDPLFLDNLSDEELKALYSKVNNFLLENNYKAHLEYFDQDSIYKRIVYDEDATVEDIFNILAALCKEFDDFGPSYYFLASSFPEFTDDEEQTTTEPTTTSLSELTTTTTTVTTITTPQPTEQAKLLGDADGDNELTVRDCSFIAITIAQGRNSDLSESADFNADGEVNVRDAAAIAKELAVK